MGFLLSLHSKLVLLLFHVVVARSVSSFQPYSCHDDDRSALLQFKQSLTIDISASGYGAYPKVSSWKPAHNGENNSCCSWDGVLCDEKTGHVIELDLSSSCLYGSINSTSSLFHLVHLQSLNLAYNNFNHSQFLPIITNFPKLRYLNLSYSFFSGEIPSKILQLSNLSILDLEHNEFNGQIPTSLANLTLLKYLSLAYNNFNGPIPDSLANLTQLEFLRLSYNNFDGSIPASFANLTQLMHLSVRGNQLTGPIPSWLGNLTRLVRVFVSDNKLSGSIPDSLFNHKNLEIISLMKNSLTGVVDIFKVQKVTISLEIGDNNLELLTESKPKNATALPQFRILELSSCNIKEFPNFLRYQQNLENLNLDDNKLHGQVPKWMWNTSTQSFYLLSLRDNFLSSFGQPTVVLPWVNLAFLFLGGNLIQGSLPIPPQSIVYYSIQGNKLTGEISASFCNRSILQYLDLSNNKLSGNIPQCLGNNHFHGILPQTYNKTSTLELIDVNYNQLEGKLPRSLGNCKMLKTLVLSNNGFIDDFPIWLGMLPGLQLLAMNHNGFYGVIESSKNHHYFPKLRVLDLSYNNFMGEFPSEYIFFGNAMRGRSMSQLPPYTWKLRSFDADFSASITNKGVQRVYEIDKIQEDLVVIDISSNQFQGNIPEFIGKLKGLRILNFAHNKFTGSIPSQLGNLTLLESLDLSQNQLSGEIPQQLAQLTFLAFFNVSKNNMTGSIPKGPQFQTFENTSFEGNPKLCGDQLLNKCKPKAPSDMPTLGMGENDSGSGIEFDWKFVLAGIVSGLLVGVVLADVAMTRRRELFLEIVCILMERINRRNRLGHKN